jgi:hypothetical protein
MKWNYEVKSGTYIQILACWARVNLQQNLFAYTAQYRTFQPYIHVKKAGEKAKLQQWHLQLFFRNGEHPGLCIDRCPQPFIIKKKTFIVTCN